MSKLTDRISYLKGLAAGLKLNSEKDSNKLLLGILDVLGEAGSSIETLEKNVQDLSDYVEDIDEDLSDIESDIYGEDEEDGTCGECGECGKLTYNCPHCGHEVEFDADDVDFDENAKCPECGHELFPEGEPLDGCKAENGCCKSGEQSGECCCKGKQTEKEADDAEKNG